MKCLCCHKGWVTKTPFKAIRSKTAALEPQKIAFFCCTGGKARAARAMTTALSPEKIMLIQMILSRPIQKSTLASISMRILEFYSCKKRRER